MVCDVCENLLPPITGGNYGFAISTLQSSALACRYCRVLASAIAAVDDGDLCDSHSFSYTLYTSEVRRPIGIQVTVRDKGNFNKALQFYNMANLSKKDQAIAPMTTFYPNTGSPVVVDWVMRKIQECQNTHKDCKTVIRGPRVLPDRVLDLGTGTDLHSDVSLYQSSGEDALYCTLSHRWGNIPPLQLIKENLAEFTKKIPWKLLPKTFQDAIIFTRRLKIRYIWIDSLCIIQNSKEDWEDQSGKMATIYELATITLSAANARNASEGCFVQPPKIATGYLTDGDAVISLEDTAATAKFLADQTLKAKILVRELLDHATPSGGIVHDRYSCSHKRPRLPLMDRGWVYQERVLSQRILHFGHVDLLWECAELVSCYCGYWRDQFPPIYPDATPLKKRLSLAMQSERYLSEASSAMDSWWRKALSEYTNLELRFASDRLPAIAGIAKQIGRHMKNPRYLAGLWEDHLLSDLLWHETMFCDYSNSDDYYWPSFTPAKERSPSWSWMSAPLRIKYQIEDVYTEDDPATLEKLRPQILEAKCQLIAENDEFLGAESGSIKLSGTLVKARLLLEGRLGSHGVILVNSEARKDFHNVILDSGLGVELHECAKVMAGWSRKSPSPSLEQTHASSSFWPNVKHMPQTASHNGIELSKQSNNAWYENLRQYPDYVWCIRMGRWTHKYRPGPWEYFLVLKCVNEAEQEYRRIGMGHYFADNEKRKEDSFNFGTYEPTLFKGVQEQKVITLL